MGLEPTTPRLTAVRTTIVLPVNERRRRCPQAFYSLGVRFFRVEFILEHMTIIPIRVYAVTELHPRNRLAAVS